MSSSWWKKGNMYMFCQNWEIIYLQQTSFDLWMSKEAHDIFAFVITFLGSNYELKQMILGYLKQQKLLVKPWLPTIRKELFGQYGLRKKKLTYVKDEGSNLIVITVVLKSIIKCEVLGLNESFQNSWFGYAFGMLVCYN